MSTGSRYLWFSPHAGNWPAFRLEHRLAEALSRDGRSVHMVHCRGVLDSYCPVMAAERLRVDSPLSEKRRACADCLHNEGLATAVATYSTSWLEDVVTPDVIAQADATLATVDEGNWRDFEVDGMPIGRWAAYLSMLHHKLPDVTASPAAWAEYRSDLRNSMLVHGAMPILFATVDPTHALVYNPLYPTTRVFAEMATRAGARLVGVAAGSFIPGRYDSAGIYPHIMSSQTTTDSSSIRGTLEIPCSTAEVVAVGAHLRELIAGNDPWVYSSAPTRVTPSEVRSRLGVRQDSPVVVALISSPDETRSSMLVDAEYFRGDGAGYSDVVEFIGMMVEAARLTPDIDVVFRLHPRLAPNKRESVTSPDLARIVDLLDDLPDNAVVNSSADALSLYDVITIADAAVNQSSSAGLEFLTLGLPVVQYDPPRLGAYPREFATCVERHDAPALAAAVRAAAADGWSLANSRRAFRWYTATLLRALLHLNDVVETYGSIDTASEQTPRVEPHPSALLRVARTVIPDAWREKAARRMARSARAATLPDSSVGGRWVSEWLERLDSLGDSGPIWEPVVPVRGVTDVDAEDHAIRAELYALLVLLGIRREPGLGAIRAALDEGLGEQVV